MKFLVFILVFIFAKSQDKFIPKRSKELITTGEIHSNNVKATIANNGWLFWGGGASGFITPSPVFSNNSGNFATVFASGMWFVGRVNGELRAAISQFSTDFIPGDWSAYKEDPILNGRDNSDYIIYYHYSERHISYLSSLLNSGQSETEQRINQYAVDELVKAQSYNSLWNKAVEQGAPEKPPGDIAAFTIYHDADLDQRENNGSNDSKSPLNIQVRQLVFSFRAEDAVNNAVFVNFQVINKNNSPIEEFSASIWSDPDVGQYSDDLLGSDPELQMIYAYNGKEEDAQYTDLLGIAPPAVGYILLQGFLIDSLGHQVYKVRAGNEIYLNNIDDIPDYLHTEVIQDKYVQEFNGMVLLDEHDSVEEFYNLANNRDAFSGQLNWEQREAIQNGIADSMNIDWMFHGDPVRGTDWIDRHIGSKYFLANMNKIELGISNGLENFNDPGFNELTFALYTSFGESRLGSVSQLKFDSYDIQQKFNSAFENFDIINPAAFISYRATKISPQLNYHRADPSFRLLWHSQTKEIDGKIVSTEENLRNGYKFEGYQIVQFKDDSRTDFIEVDIQDIKNQIRTISNKVILEGSNNLVSELTIKAKDSGIQYYKNIEWDYYRNTKIYANNSYYYGIRAYYYHPNPPDKKSFVKFGEWSASEKEFIAKSIELGSELSSEFEESIQVDYLTSASDGKAIITVMDPYLVTGKEYKIKFKSLEERTYHLGYANDSIPANTLVWYLEENNQQVSKFFPQSETGEEFNYALYYEGLRIVVTGPPADFKQFTVVANANGILDPPDMAAFAFNGHGFPLVDGHDRPNASRQQTNGSTWGIHMSLFWMTSISNASYANFVNDVGFYMGGINGASALAPALAGGRGIHHAIPNDYEIRFTANPGKATLRDDNIRLVVDVPFELWNTGIDQNDISDDYRMVPFIMDVDGNHKWNIRNVDHVLSGGDNDPPSEGIYFLDPTDKTPGQSGYEAIIAAATADAASNWATSITAYPYAYNSPLHTVGFNGISLVNWNGGSVNHPNFPTNIDAIEPETGTIFRISMGKINTESTVFSFKAPEPPNLYDSKLAQSQFEENLTVFPNPFYLMQSNQKDINDTFVTFANLPALENNESVNITIYSLNGNLVKNLKYTGKSTLQRWKLDNNSNRKINSGLYIAILKYLNVSVIKKILIFV